jgi:hypothetical protein
MAQVFSGEPKKRSWSAQTRIKMTTRTKSTRPKESEVEMSQQPANKRTAKPKTAQDKSTARKKAPAKTAGAKGADKARRSFDRLLSSLEESPREVSGMQSGDLQGLSNLESADSESVDELLEEGNAFEAGIVQGIEDSRGREGQEIRTREVPEDDVPGEYLDQD